MEAEKRAEVARSTATYERSLADALAVTYDNLRNYLTPRQASQDPQLRSEAASRLREPPRLPERFREVGSQMQLRTNADLQSRAPDYVNRLGDDAERYDDLAAKDERDAARARQAARQLAGFREKLDHRVANMNSLNPANGTSSLTGDEKFVVDGKSGKRSISDITSRTDIGLESDSAKGVATGASRSPASVSAAKVVDKNSSEVVIDPKTGKPAKGESLREILRRRLAAQDKREKNADGKDGGPENGKGPGDARQAKSGFVEFFEEGMGAAGGEGVEVARNQSGFFLSGPETDQVVAKFVGSIDRGSQGGTAEVFGDSSVNIFHRMSSFLRKCQAEKKVATARP